jgi:hypothetical protein
MFLELNNFVTIRWRCRAHSESYFQLADVVSDGRTPLSRNALWAGSAWSFPLLGRLTAHDPETLVAIHSNVGEYEFRMLALQWEENFPDAVGYGKHHALVALADANNLLGVHFGPLQRHTFLLAQSTGRTKSKNGS